MPALEQDGGQAAEQRAGAGVQTLPIWIYQNLARPNQAPIVNVVAALLIVLSVIPVWLAQRLSADTSGGRL